MFCIFFLLLAAYVHDLLEVHDNESIYLNDILSPKSSLKSSDVPPEPQIQEADPPVKKKTPRRVINFTKCYDLYAVIAELEIWRNNSTFRDFFVSDSSVSTSEVKNDKPAIVFNHMNDFPLVQDAKLDKLK
jgi:hypothetical protein